MALLASTYLDMDEFGSLSITESLRLSGPLIEKALELDPQEPDAWAAQGYRQQRLDQTAQAGESLRHALDLAPSHIRALRRYANVLNAQGGFRKFLEITRTLSKLDPQNPNHIATYEYHRAFLGENEAVEEALGRLRELHYNDPRFYDASASYYRSSLQFDRMIMDMLRTRVLRPADAWAPGYISSVLFSLGVADAGEQWLNKVREVNPDSRYLLMASFERFRAIKQYSELAAFMRDAWMSEATEGNYLRLGAALMLAGQATESYEVLKESLAKYPYDPETGNVSFGTDSALWLALAARTVGDDALAGDLLAKVSVQVSNAIEQRYYVLNWQPSRAAYYALAGERIRALYTLQQAADNGYSVPYYLETPFFDTLKDNSDFQAILEKVQANQAAMREKVLALDNLLPQANAG